MTSLLALIRNESPVPQATRRASLSTSSVFRDPSKRNEIEVLASISTLYKVVNLRAASVAQTEWRLYRTSTRRTRTATTETDERVVVDSHRALEVWHQPNPFTTQTHFVKTWSQHRDLTGEAYILPVTTNGVPSELWQARPDRMTPQPHPTEFLVGWTYTGPDGDKIPLGVDEVWQFKDPNPADPYRGLGPIQALMVDIESARAGAEWNRNFFLNSAEPGGIIEAAEGLTDDEFEDLARRWNEQHQGVRNAHRVAVIEHGKWVDRSFSMRDMQFSELRNLSRDIIREAYAMPKTLLGIGESVNRATAQAAWAIYLEQEIRQRLVELRRWLNHEYLPLFGRTAQGVEFDFVDPVPTDNEAANAELEAKSGAAAALVAAGYDPEGVLAAVGLPPIDVAAVAPVPMAPANLMVRNQTLPPDQLPDVTPLQATFEKALEELVGEWEGIEDAQKAELVAQVLQVAQSGDYTQLAQLDVDKTAAVAALVAAMSAMAADGAASVVREAGDQGVEVEQGTVDENELAGTAVALAGLIAGRLVASATATALRANSRASTPQAVAEAVRVDLAALSTDGPKPRLAGALTGSQNDGRFATLQRAPVATLYASEVNDRNTCGPCRDIDGKPLGTSDNIDQVRSLYPGAGFGGFIYCEGRERCRGTVVPRWE